MKHDVQSPIPKITVDLITATAVIGKLGEASLRQRCAVVQAIADRGLQVDDLTVGQLMQLALEVRD